MPELLAADSRQGRLTLAAVTLGSAVSLLDGTVVNIAVRTIGDDLDASLGQLQWVVNGYMLSLASLILVGGSLGDRLGRRRVYVVGLVAFAAASLVCALAQSPSQLIGARVLQGVAGAMVTPAGLAIIQGSFRREDRSRAIGLWAGISGIAAAAGPLVGGLLLEHGGWRLIFLINLPLCLVVVMLCLRAVPESRDDEVPGRFDLAGALMGVVALGAGTFALTGGEAARHWLLPATVVALVGAAGFVWLERRPGSLVPLSLFGSRVFTAANLMTFLVYGALGAVLFMLVLQLQVSVGFSALQAGLAPLPLTIAMLFLSSRFAVLAAAIGPRVPMTIGPIVMGTGVLLLAGVGPGTSYWTGVLPGTVLFGLGLSGMVAPLTAAVLSSAPDRHAGIASGVNNAIARAGSLLAVAALPAAVGLTGADYRHAAVLTEGYQNAQLICAALLWAGGLVSWFGLRGLTTSVSDPAGK